MRRSAARVINILLSAGVDVRVSSKSYDGKTLRCKALILDDRIMVGSANLSQNAMKRNIEDIWLLSGDIIDRYKLTFTRRWSNIAVPFSKRFIVKRNEETGRSKVPQLCSAVSDYFPGARTHGFSFTEFLLSGPNNDSSPSSPDLETPGSTPAPDLIPASTPVSTPAPAPTTAPASASTTTPASILAENQHDENLCRVDGCNARVQIRGRCLDVTAKEPRVRSRTVQRQLVMEVFARYTESGFADCKRSARVRGVCYTHGAKKNCRNEGCATPTRFAGLCWKHGPHPCAVVGCESRQV
ncbi:hypothetical protein PC128_g9457 [Phytophthora cactorum]|nr:hypothetical protein PC128_g9457 [Phytophthora cactorum]